MCPIDSKALIVRLAARDLPGVPGFLLS